MSFRFPSKFSRGLVISLHQDENQGGGYRLREVNGFFTVLSTSMGGRGGGNPEEGSNATRGA
jgi:hypothetical protein